MVVYNTTMDTTQKEPKFKCADCDYTTDRQSQFNRHTSTSKHQNNTKQVKKVKEHVCSICNKKYKHHSSLWKHSLCCSTPNTTPVDLTALVAGLVKSNNELQKQISELSNRVTSLVAHP
jgi:hypothetical protein